MSDEEWWEIRLAFQRDVRKLKQLLATNPAAFWKYPSVGKCGERLRSYLEKTAEMNRKDPFG